ncbi:unnamed protein product, partial [Ectocarpus fasciculatus]
VESVKIAHSSPDCLQRLGEALRADPNLADLHDVEKLLTEVDSDAFPQASVWEKSWTSMRCVVADTAETPPSLSTCVSISVLVLPRGTKLEWHRYHEARSVSRQLFGKLSICDAELQGSDNARKLEQQELEATYADGWAVGGSEESDCVCRGGRCPRMWDCPFWVDRRRAEAKGSSAHVALRTPEESFREACWRAGPQTVRRIEALAPSALLEVHVGPRSTRYYKEIASQAEDAVELIETLTPLGVKPGVCRYLGPSVDLRG